MQPEKIIAAICSVSRKKPADVKPHLLLTTLGLTSSFGLNALRSMLEADSGKKLPILHSSMTVNELMGLMGGEGAVMPSAPATKPAPVMRAARTAPMPAAGFNLGVGLDMQEIEMLPAADNFREDKFYAANFAAQELATASLKPDPRAHLCGVFCAKEAAKKSHPDLLNLRLDEIIVLHDAAGKPLLKLKDGVLPGRSFQFNLSITHTEKTAAAACITLWS